MTRRKLHGLTMLTGLALGLALAGCGGDKPAQDAPTPPQVQARTQVVSPAALPSHHATPGTVVARERVEVASRLMGYLSDIAVAEGQAVKKGQRLFTVDPLDVQGQAEQARLGVKLAEDAYADAKADYERFANLFKEEVVTRQQFEKMKLQLDVATSRLAQARAGHATASGQLRYASVTSPISGVVTRKLADAGDMASPGQPVLVVEDASHLQVETQVPEAVLRGLKPGQTVAVEVDGRDQPLEGRVARLSPAADPVSRTFLVKLDVVGEGLMSGAFARVLFPVAERQALAVPRAALVNRAGIDGVFVVGADGIARFRMVRTGERVGDTVEVQAGLVAGERIVVDGLDRLESGAKVTG